MSVLKTLHLFCRVVDNYGDIGICWRLARQLQHEHGIAVTLWVDDLTTFERICPGLDTAATMQHVEDVAIRHWHSQEGNFTPDQVANIVIEFFACNIPEGYIAAMAQRRPRPVWLNLEGLTAEEWVEGCHRMASRHPQLPLTKYFFFPGFTGKTGGLLCEAGLEAQRRRFLADDAGAFLAGLGVSEAEASACKVSLFCYPHAPVSALIDAWSRGGQAVTCLVPEGVAREAVEHFLGQPALPGAARTEGNLSLRVLPFVPQPDYDKLLWACDFNFVRGEDSFVRAQWAGKPFIWHIYPQDENLHHVKLRAFLGRYAAELPALAAASLAWNGAEDNSQDGQTDLSTSSALSSLWPAMQAELPQMLARAENWCERMHEIGDLATNLVKFAGEVATPGQEKQI